MAFIALSALCGIVVYIVQQFFAFRRMLEAIRHHPGRRTILSGIGASGFIIKPSIPLLTPGNNADFKNEYKEFEKYGCDIFSAVFFLPKITARFLIADAEATKEITASRARFPKPVRLYQVLSFYGKNIVASEGDEWKVYRKISAPSFSERNNRLVWDETIQIVSSLINDVWGSQNEVTDSDFMKTTMAITLYIISAAGFGQRISWRHSGIKPKGYVMAFKDAIYTVSTKLFLKLVVPKKVMDLEVTENIKSIKIGFDELQRYMVDMIRLRRTAETKEEKYDLLSSLLDANDEESDGTSKLSDSELIGNIFIFLIAGHETTGHTFAFTFALLALYPEEQQKLYEQTKSILRDNKIPKYEHIGLYTYAMAVFYETLRLFPPVTGIPKIAAEDTVFMTHNREGERVPIFIPKGADIMINTPALHRNPRYWEDPDSFKPARFLGDWPRDAFLPFSGGVRSCLGKRFAETEAIAMITVIISQYKVEVMDEPQFAGETFEQRKARILDCVNGLTLTPKRVPLVFKRRL